MIAQRWRAGRDSYRPAGETIRTSDYDVAELPDDATPKAFVLEHHYSGTYPAARFRFGLYRASALVGAAVFSHPCNDAVLSNTFPGVPIAESAELGRFVLLDDVPGNGETWFLARCFEQLRGRLAGVVSFSDPEPRRAASGLVVFPGHLGTIYQAHNAAYLGRSTARTLRLLPDGSVLSDRALQKIRTGERGWRYAVEQLVRAGAPAGPASADPGELRAWLAQALGVTRTMRHKGNHRYRLGPCARGATQPHRRAVSEAVGGRLSKVEVYNEDCIRGMRERIANDSVHCLVTSIPFGSLFSYSHKPEDIGNCRDGVTFTGTQFGLAMRFWFEEVARVMAPGCIVAIHVQQLNTTQVQHGHQGIRDFRGAVIDMGRKHGLQPHGEVAIPKNPQRIAQVRKLHSLLFVSGRRDSRALAPANNDFVLFFRKPGEGRPVLGLFDAVKNPRGHFTQEEWIRWARGCWEDGWKDEAALEQLEGYREMRDAYLLHEWRHAPIWGDIVEIDTLEGWRGARETDEERHVCPLQLEVIRRCILLYTSPGDLVLEPFAGIGSVPWVAIEQGRDCVAFELKESYHAMTLRNVAKARELFEGKPQRDLFSEGAA